MNYETTITAEVADNVAADVDGRVADPNAKRSGVSRWLIYGGLGLLGLLLGIGAYFALTTAEPEAAGDDESQAPVVTVVAPGKTTVEGTIEAPGTLAARREMPVGVAGEGGQVTRVLVDAGDWVGAGQVLAVVDQSVQVQQIGALAAQIEVRRSELKLAQANLDRALQLVERGFISKADVDRLTATRDQAQAQVRVAQAQLNERRARNRLLNVVAPAAGFVLERNVEPGQTIGGGSPALFLIARGGEMEMLAALSETQLAGLGQGVTATVVPTGSEKRFTGQVWQVSPVIDPQSRQGTARIALSYAPELRPGGFATATISSGTITATVLPESAVLADDEGAFVYIVGKDNKATRKSVKTGMVTPKGITITEGLSGNELIVLKAGGFLNPGETVKPQKQKKGSRSS